MGKKAQEGVPVRREPVLQGINQHNEPAMSDDSQEEVSTVPRGKKRKVSLSQEQGYKLGSVVKEDRQDKEQDKAYDGDGTAIRLVSSSSAKRVVSLDVSDTESATEDDVVEVSKIVYEEAVKDEQMGGSRSPKDPSDCMGNPKKGYERTSQNNDIQGCQVGTTINEEEQRHVLVQCLKDINTLKDCRKKTLMRATVERREKLTVESIRERFGLYSGVNNFNSHHLSVDMEDFYKTQRALLASYDLKKSEGPFVYHRFAAQGQNTPSAPEYLPWRGSTALTRETFESNHVSFVFVVHKQKGLLLKKIQEGSLLRYEVPGGVVSESDYATAGKVSMHF